MHAGDLWLLAWRHACCMVIQISAHGMRAKSKEGSAWSLHAGPTEAASMCKRAQSCLHLKP